MATKQTNRTDKEEQWYQFETEVRGVLQAGKLMRPIYIKVFAKVIR